MPLYNLPDGRTVDGQSRVQCFFEHHNDTITLPANSIPRMSQERRDQLGITLAPATQKPAHEPTRQEMIDRVIAERARRLAAGFDYDFEDDRGVHNISTSKEDWEAWKEVKDLASEYIDSGDREKEIDIVTNTGPVTVTAKEWKAIMLAAHEARQVVWARSFALQALDTIPEDYNADTYWT